MLVTFCQSPPLCLVFDFCTVEPVSEIFVEAGLPYFRMLYFHIASMIYIHNAQRYGFFPNYAGCSVYLLFYFLKICGFSEVIRIFVFALWVE